MVRTRAAAAELATSGHVRVNGARIDAASRAVTPGDVVTVALDRAVRVLRVLGFAERRGSAEAARALCADLEPALDRATEAPPPPDPAPRLQGTGRPTKRERRALERFTGEEEL